MDSIIPTPSAILIFLSSSFTGFLRRVILTFLDILLPYYVASRALRTKDDFRDALMCFVIATMRTVEPKITDAVFGVLGVDKSVKSRTSLGGTAPANVRSQARRWIARLAKESAAR